MKKIVPYPFIIIALFAGCGKAAQEQKVPERTVKVHFSTKGHNGILVPVYAYGPGAEAFTGIHENAEVSNIIRRLMK